MRTFNEVQVTWPTAADSKSVSAGATQDSEAGTFDGTAERGTATCKAKNDGTPAAGDTMDFFIKYTNGDPDGSGADEYDSDEHATFLCQLDTNQEDPAQRTVPISVAAKGYKIFVRNNSGGRAITASSSIGEIRS